MPIPTSNARLVITVVPFVLLRISLSSPSLMSRRNVQCIYTSARLPYRSVIRRCGIEENLSHLDHTWKHLGTFAQPRQCFVQRLGFQYPKSAHELFGFQIRPVGDNHLTVAV